MPYNLTYEFRPLSVNDVAPNGYNPNRMSPGQFAALKRTMRKDGFVGVILVRPSHSGYVIIDGEHRWRAARELSQGLVPCAVVQVTEEQARALTVKLNQIHGDWVPDLLAELVSDLPEPLADLGFAEGELEALLQQFRETEVLGATDVGDDNHASHLQNDENERYIGFNLNRKRRQLLEDALQAASSKNQDRTNLRAGCLEVILQSFLHQAVDQESTVCLSTDSAPKSRTA